MKKTELLEIIRTLVKEEINNTLPQLLMEVLAERMTENASSIMESKKVDSTPRRSTSVSFEEPLTKKPVAAPKMFTKNPALNAVLNETIGGVPQEDTSVPSAIDMIKSLPKEALNENKEIAAVATAMTKDYSQLMKAIDAKAKAKRPV